MQKSAVFRPLGSSPSVHKARGDEIKGDPHSAEPSTGWFTVSLWPIRKKREGAHNVRPRPSHQPSRLDQFAILIGRICLASKPWRACYNLRSSYLGAESTFGENRERNWSRVRGDGRHCLPSPGETGETEQSFRPEMNCSAGDTRIFVPEGNTEGNS